MHNRPVKLLDVVALLDDKPGVFEVEFLDANGRTIALGEFRREELLLLRHDAAMAV